MPEAVDDYVEADNSVRFIDAFVDGLDLAGAGFARVEAKATGRPGYAPSRWSSPCGIVSLCVTRFGGRPPTR